MLQITTCSVLYSRQFVFPLSLFWTDGKNMCGLSILSGAGMYWELDLFQGKGSTEPVWQVRDCRLGWGRDGVAFSQGTAAKQPGAVCRGGTSRGARGRCAVMRAVRVAVGDEGAWGAGKATANGLEEEQSYEMQRRRAKSAFHSASDLTGNFIPCPRGCWIFEALWNTLIKSSLCTQQGTHFNISWKKGQERPAEG